MKRRTMLAFAAGLGLTAAVADARNFFNRGGVALYNPIVDVVNSGARLVAQPTVSADLKYVTVAAQPQVSQIISIANFPVAPGFGGLVGGAQPANGNEQAGNAAAAGGGNVGNGAANGNGNVLSRPGMRFLGRP
jgi:hypothetical protein